MALDLPARFQFGHPREVAESSTMSAPQKLRILLDWLQDEFALLVADNEGMIGSRSPRPDQVQAALHALLQATETWRRSPWPTS